MKKPSEGKKPKHSDANRDVTDKNYNNNIPLSVIGKLESEMQGVDFGGVSLIIAIRDGRPTFRIEKTVSIMPMPNNQRL